MSTHKYIFKINLGLLKYFYFDEYKSCKSSLGLPVHLLILVVL